MWESVTPQNRIIIFAAALLLSLFATFSVLYFANMLQGPMEPVPLDTTCLAWLVLDICQWLFFIVYFRPLKGGRSSRLLLTLGLGFGSTFGMMILLGILWQISLLSVLVVQISLLITLTTIAVAKGLRFNAALFSVSQNGSDSSTKQTVFQVFLLIIVFTLVSLGIYDALALPPLDWDSLAYGVNYAKIIFQNSHIPLIAGPQSV